MLYAVEQGGRIRAIGARWHACQPSPFLDIADEVERGGEQGLLGLAFHPDFAIERPTVRGLHPRPRWRHVISELAPRTAGVADRASERVMLEMPNFACQPQRRHARLRRDGDAAHRHSATVAGAATRRATARTSASCWPSCCASMSMARRRTACLPMTRRAARRGRASRDPGHAGCATRGGSASTGSTGDVFIGDVGQDHGKRSTSCRPAHGRAELRLEHHGGRRVLPGGGLRPTPARPSRSRLFPLPAATAAPSSVATCIGARRSRRSKARTSTATTAPATCGCCRRRMRSRSGSRRTAQDGRPARRQPVGLRPGR